MKTGPDVEDLRLWAVVAATVRPLQPARLLTAQEKQPIEKAEVKAQPGPPKAAQTTSVPEPVRPAQAKSRAAKSAKGRERPADIDAGLRRRLARGRDAVAARIDLHGLDQDAARSALTRFISRSADEGWRAVLVITGKGVGGDGVLRRRTPDWLAASPIREHVAGVSEAHRRHGGEGALYVALKRRR